MNIMSQPLSNDEKQLYQTAYATLMNTWFTNSLELDKSLLTISAGGIGLSFTMIQIFKSSVVFNFMVSVSFLFTLTIFSILAIFNFNNKRLKQEIECKMQYITSGNYTINPESAITENILIFLDSVRNITFLIGIVVFLISFFFTNPQEENQKKPESTGSKIEQSESRTNHSPSQEIRHENNISISISNNKTEHSRTIKKNNTSSCPPKKIASSETINNLTIKCCGDVCNTAQSSQSIPR